MPTAYTDSFASLSRIVAAREASGASNHTEYARDVYRGIKEPKTQWTIGVAAVLEKFDDLGVVDFLVREIGLCCTCWWYSLCNFQYRQHYENTGSDHFDG